MEGKSSDWLRGPSGHTVCRCCFAEGCYKDISTEYFWMGKREVYAEMLTETFDINIAFAQSSGPNSNSRLICEPCISRLRDASEFKRQVQECERMFMQYLDPGRVVACELESIPETLEKEVKLEPVKQEKGHSDDDFDERGGFDDDDDDLDDEPLTKLASKVPKKESVDLLDLLDNAKAAEKRKSTTKVKTSPAKKAKTKKETPKATASKTKPEKKKKELLGVNVEAQRNARIILRHSTAYPFRYSMDAMKVQCSLCVALFDNPSVFRNHMDTEHASVDRSKALKRRGSTRVDITDLRCKICTTNCSTIECLVSHLNKTHQLEIQGDHHGLVPIRLEKNRFQCFVCSQLFTGLKQLCRHTGTHFTKYICHICGKNFETSTGLRLHSKYNHSSSEICKFCKKSFPTAKARKEHMKTTKACYPTLCRICNERFLTFELKQDHLVNVHGKEKIVYPCTECDEVFTQRYALYAHFKTTHTDDNKCLYCNKQFPSKAPLAEHTARYHTGEQPFTCNVCDKTFFTNKSLQRHSIIHDDSKKFACPICSRLFARSYKLKHHIAKDHLTPGET